MPRSEEVVIDSDEDTPLSGCAPSHQFAEEWSQFRVAYDKWMYCPDYGSSAHEILFVTDNAPDLPQQSRWILDAVRNITRTISTDEVSEEDLIGLSLTAWGNVGQHAVVVMGMRQKVQVNLLKVFKGIKRDRSTFLSNGPLVVKVKIVRRNTQQRLPDVRFFHERCRSKKSIITAGATSSPVENLSRALALSKAYIQREESAKLNKIFKRLRSSNEVHLKVEADALRKMAIGRPEDRVALAVRLFDRYYSKTFTITVFLGLDGRHVAYESWALPVAGRPHMDVVTDGREFHVVTSVSSAFSPGQQHQYCRLCRVHYRYETEHQCLECCRHCRKVGVCVPQRGKRCGTCKRDFVSDDCFRRHLDENRAGKSTCDLLKMCEYCLEWYSVEGRRKRHICGDRFCKNCKEKCPANHPCFARGQSNQVRASVNARGNGRPLSVGRSADNSASAKRRRVDVDMSVRGASQGDTRAIFQSATASTSREYVERRGSSSYERNNAPANRLFDPVPRSPNVPTAAHPRESSLSGGGSVGSSQYNQIRSPLRSDVVEASGNGSSGQVTRSPTASAAASPRNGALSAGIGAGSRQSTSAGSSLHHASPATGNQPTVREAERGGPQRGGVAVAADLPAEGGNVPPHPVRALLYPEEKKISSLFRLTGTGDSFGNSNA